MEPDLEDHLSGPPADAALPPDPRARRAVGIDIGGTKIGAGVITAEGLIIDRALVPTPMGDEPATISAMRGVIEELRERHPSVEAIGVGAAGLVDWPSGCCTRRPGCRPWSTTTPTPPPGPRRVSGPAPAATTWSC
jgi:predicted NBD/HSP70 family sugar kinase